MKKFAFTLAEIMIVLSIIAVLTAILLPAARNAMPNEKVMKFKKGHQILLNVISELVNSDKYYLDGDLGVAYDGTIINNSENTSKYFCATIADIANVKKMNCEKQDIEIYSEAVFINGFSGSLNVYTPMNATKETIKEAKKRFDTLCFGAQTLGRKEQLTLQDNSIIYTLCSTGFGSGAILDENGVQIDYKRYYSPPLQNPANFSDLNGFDMSYKTFCLDIDDLNYGEAPFGYGIRADGKILNGARADEWLAKSIQDKD